MLRQGQPKKGWLVITLLAHLTYEWWLGKIFFYCFELLEWEMVYEVALKVSGCAVDKTLISVPVKQTINLPQISHCQVQFPS